MFSDKDLVYPKNRENISWKVPSLFNNDETILHLSDVCKELGLRQPIQSVYGSIKSAWGGGRPSKIKEMNKDDVAKTLNDYNSRGISCCFTFSSFSINEEELEDKTGNMLLTLASEGNKQNYAIVSSDTLAFYIRKNYPKIKLISSILKPVYEIDDYNETPEYYNSLCEKYDKVVIRPDFCHDEKFLKKLKYKDKIEIMTNLTCIRKCPLTRKHYDLFSDIEKGIRENDFDFCNKEMRNAKSVFNTNLLTNSDVDRLVKLGFKNFKLKGRNIPQQRLLEMIGIYIFEPSGIYQNINRLVCLRTS